MAVPNEWIQSLVRVIHNEPPHHEVMDNAQLHTLRDAITKELFKRKDPCADPDDKNWKWT